MLHILPSHFPPFPTVADRPKLGNRGNNTYTRGRWRRMVSGESHLPFHELGAETSWLFFWLDVEFLDAVFSWCACHLRERLASWEALTELNWIVRILLRLLNNAPSFISFVSLNGFLFVPFLFSVLVLILVMKQSALGVLNAKCCFVFPVVPRLGGVCCAMPNLFHSLVLYFPFNLVAPFPPHAHTQRFCWLHFVCFRFVFHVVLQLDHHSTMHAWDLFMVRLLHLFYLLFVSSFSNDVPLYFVFVMMCNQSCWKYLMHAVKISISSFGTMFADTCLFVVRLTMQQHG